MQHPSFVISLDFELHWGVRDHRSVPDYREHLLGVRQVVPQLLEVFRKHDVASTWATVGFCFFESRDELLDHLPALKPSYTHTAFSPYPWISSEMSADTADDLFHYAADQVTRVVESDRTEVATHTFSHYYTLEEGQTPEQFRADLQAAKTIASRRNITLKSIVFPRNQYGPRHLEICLEEGLIAYRGNPQASIYHPRQSAQNGNVSRAIRLLDAHLPINGLETHPSTGPFRPVNVPATRFLRPAGALGGLRARRICAEMTEAAKANRLYHLWWHPHNFGANPTSNIRALSNILGHLQTLRTRYGMRSSTMAECAQATLDART
jgi:hypothetical protein